MISELDFSDDCKEGNAAAPLGHNGDRLFMSSRGLLPRAAFVQYLRQCADEWMRIADGSFYGVTRKTVDAASVRQAERIRLLAKEIADENHRA